MSIPGLSIPGLSTADVDIQITAEAPTEPSPSRTHTLPAGSEYRFELPLKTAAPASVFSNISGSDPNVFSIKVTSGNAEIFGTELATGNEYNFPTGAKGAVFTWNGAEIEVQGEVESEFVAEETSMVEAANVHFALESLRSQFDSPSNFPPSSSTDSVGPRVLVLGGKDSGKTSLCKTLTAYATRLGRQPVVVNIDPDQGHASIPGALTATVTARLLDPTSGSGWGSSGITGPSPVQTQMPLAYFYGMAGLRDSAPTPAGGRDLPGSRRAVWRALATRMALAATSRMEEDHAARAAGCIIDTPAALADKKCYDLVEHVISEFSINVVLVLGSERLFSDLRRKFVPQGSAQTTSGEESVRVVKLSKSEGCVARDEAYMKALRAQQIRGYYFGDKGISLNPLTVMVGFDDITIYRYSEASSSNTLSSYLPGDDSDSESEYQPSLASSSSAIFTKTNPSLALSNAILAIPHTASPTSPHADILTSSIMGFAYVADVDETRKAIRLLVPTPTRLEGRMLVWGNWPEGVVDLLG